MQVLQQFINSLSVEQVALAFGVMSLVFHSLLNRGGDRLSKPLNKFIVRFQVAAVPVMVAFATDPHVADIVRNYFPSLVVYFTTYQGGYQFFKTVKEKWDSLKELAGVDENDNLATGQTAEQLAE